MRTVEREPHQAGHEGMPQDMQDARWQAPDGFEYMRDLAIELQRMADRAGCHNLAVMFGRAAAEAHHEYQSRQH